MEKCLITYLYPSDTNPEHRRSRQWGTGRKSRSCECGLTLQPLGKSWLMLPQPNCDGKRSARARTHRTASLGALTSAKPSSTIWYHRQLKACSPSHACVTDTDALTFLLPAATVPICRSLCARFPPGRLELFWRSTEKWTISL